MNDGLQNALHGPRLASIGWKTTSWSFNFPITPFLRPEGANLAGFGSFGTEARIFLHADFLVAFGIN
jgi:hypothetical protein